MPNSKLNRRTGSPEPGPSKRDRYLSSDEEDDVFPRKEKDKSSKQGQLSKKVSIGGGNQTPCHNKPAELFRKDLISAMKMADTEILYESEYIVISDPWRQEWEMGVQVPISEKTKPVTIVTLKKESATDFKLPPRKLLHNRQDDTYLPNEHVITGMEEMADRIVRYDLDDQDVQWLQLVNEDREEMGLQLINEWNMERMIEELENQCYIKTNVLKKTEEGLGIEYDEDIACDVCRLLESEDTNEMVFCDGCDVCVHQACYGVQNIPEGDWLCRICALGIKPMCLLCPKRGGAMKPTKSGTKWTHVSCALWIPEVSIGCPEKMEPITKISNIPHSRWALVCCLCKERVGACIQCSVKQCKTAFHVTCGFAHNLDMRTMVDDTDDIDGIHLKAYCPKHTKNRNASECDSPKKGDEYQEEDIISEAEVAKKRLEKLTELEEQFFDLVDKSEVARRFFIPEEAVDIVGEYWKLKRKMNNNKQLITVKMEEEDQMQRQQKDSLTARMKLFIHLRQDLERARNLCCMISRREKTKRHLSNVKEEVFRAQLSILTNPDLQLSAKDAQQVRRETRFNSIYCSLTYKSSDKIKSPRENVFTLEHLKTPKDFEEEKEKQEKEKQQKKKTGVSKAGKIKPKITDTANKANNNSVKKKPKSAKKLNVSKVENSASNDVLDKVSNIGEKVGDKVEKCEDDEVSTKDGIPLETSEIDVGSLGNEKEESSALKISEVVAVEPCNEGASPDKTLVSCDLQKKSSEIGGGSLSKEEESSALKISEVVAGELCNDSVSPNKNLIPCDLRKKLSSLLQSKNMMQQKQEKSELIEDPLHVKVEDSDSEALLSEVNTELPAPIEERMNVFDKFTVEKKSESPDTAKDKTAISSSQSLVSLSSNVKEEKTESTLETFVKPLVDISIEVGEEEDIDVTDELLKTPEGIFEKIKEEKERHSSHKKSKKRKHSRTSHKRKRSKSYVSPPPSVNRLSVSPIIIKTGGDSTSSIISAKRDRSPLSPSDKRSGEFSPHSLHHHNSSSSKSGKNNKKKRSHQEHDDFVDEDTGTEKSPCPEIHWCNRDSSLSSAPGLNESTQLKEDGNQQFEKQPRLSSKLRLKKQASPVKGVVSYQVINVDDSHETQNEQMGSGDAQSVQSSRTDKQASVTEKVQAKAKNIFEQVYDHAIKKDLSGNDSTSSLQSVAKIETKESDSNNKIEQYENSTNSETKIAVEDSNNKTEAQPLIKEENASSLRPRSCRADETKSHKSEDHKGLDNNVKDSVEGDDKLRKTRRNSKSEKKKHNRITRHSISVDIIDINDDSKDENFRPNNPAINVPLRNKSPRRLRKARRQLPSDETDGDDYDEDDEDSDACSNEDENKDSCPTGTNNAKSSVSSHKDLNLKSPLPDKPELNKLLMDPSKLLVKKSLRRRVREKLPAIIRGRSRWRTIKMNNQTTLDMFVQRTSSCENVFSKLDNVRNSVTKSSSMSNVLRSDVSPLSVNLSPSVVNSKVETTNEGGASHHPILISPMKDPTPVFGAHTLRHTGTKNHHSPRHHKNSSSSKLKDNSPADNVKNENYLSNTISDSNEILFGDADKLRSGLRRQLSFENMHATKDSKGVDLAEVVKTPSKCDSSKLIEDPLDGSQSYRSPSPVSSVASVSSSTRAGRLRLRGQGLEDDSDEESPSKRVTRSKVQDNSLTSESPSSRLRRSESSSIVRPLKLSLS